MTEVRSPARHVAPEQKPTPIRKGHWRNMWFCSSGWEFGNPGEIIVDPQTTIAPKRYPSRELAEEFATKSLRRNFAPGGKWFGYPNDVRYLGPVFFPEAEGK